AFFGREFSIGEVHPRSRSSTREHPQLPAPFPRSRTETSVCGRTSARRASGHALYHTGTWPSLSITWQLGGIGQSCAIDEPAWTRHVGFHPRTSRRTVYEPTGIRRGRRARHIELAHSHNRIAE